MPSIDADAKTCCSRSCGNNHQLNYGTLCEVFPQVGDSEIRKTWIMLLAISRLLLVIFSTQHPFRQAYPQCLNKYMCDLNFVIHRQ